MSATVTELRPTPQWEIVEGPQFWTTPAWDDPDLSCGGGYIDFGDGPIPSDRYHEATLAAFTTDDPDDGVTVPVRLRISRIDGPEQVGPVAVALVVNGQPARLDRAQRDALIAALTLANEYDTP